MSNPECGSRIACSVGSHVKLTTQEEDRSGSKSHGVLRCLPFFSTTGSSNDCVYSSSLAATQIPACLPMPCFYHATRNRCQSARLGVQVTHTSAMPLSVNLVGQPSADVLPVEREDDHWARFRQLPVNCSTIVGTWPSGWLSLVARIRAMMPARQCNHYRRPRRHR